MHVFTNSSSGRGRNKTEEQMVGDPIDNTVYDGRNGKKNTSPTGVDLCSGICDRYQIKNRTSILENAISVVF